MALDVLLEGLRLQMEYFWIGGWLACMAIWLIIFILIAVWVYRDAESRGMNGALWLIIVIIAGLLGLIIYLVVRSEKKPQYAYPQQPAQPYQPPPAEAPRTPTFCSSCGARLTPGARHCPNCGAKVQ